MTNEETPIPRRRRTDNLLSQWTALALSSIMALGGTAAFTFHVYDSLRADLARVSLIEPTLSAHIEADRELQRICQERVDYLERRFDEIRKDIKEAARNR